MAKTELDSLEQRFRLRVEHGYGGMPLTSGMMLKFATPAEPVPQPSALLAQMPAQPPGVAPAPNTAVATNAAATFLQNFAAAAVAAAAGNGASSTSNPGGAPAPQFPFAMPPAAASAPSAQHMAPPFAGAPGAHSSSAASQWLLPNPPQGPVSSNAASASG